VGTRGVGNTTRANTNRIKWCQILTRQEHSGQKASTKTQRNDRRLASFSRHYVYYTYNTSAQSFRVRCVLGFQEQNNMNIVGKAPPRLMPSFETYMSLQSAYLSAQCIISHHCFLRYVYRSFCQVDAHRLLRPYELTNHALWDVFLSEMKRCHSKSPWIRLGLFKYIFIGISWAMFLFQFAVEKLALRFLVKLFSIDHL